MIAMLNKCMHATLCYLHAANLQYGLWPREQLPAALRDILPTSTQVISGWVGLLNGASMSMLRACAAAVLISLGTQRADRRSALNAFKVNRHLGLVTSAPARCSRYNNTYAPTE